MIRLVAAALALVLMFVGLLVCDAYGVIGLAPFGLGAGLIMRAAS